MKYVQLGNSGLIVSKLAFGAMTFGSGNIPSVYKVGQDQAQVLVDQALDAGINFFDTADAYAEGQSEVMLGGCWGRVGRKRLSLPKQAIGWVQGLSKPVYPASIYLLHVRRV
jgi:aryl-alcohol dehydrogenase-like predicted oxidoreductase